MKKGQGSSIIILDRYTMKKVASFQTVNEASAYLAIPASSIYVSICQRISIYECFFLYEKDMQKFKPSQRVFRRVRGVKVSEKLEQLRSMI